MAGPHLGGLRGALDGIVRFFDHPPLDPAREKKLTDEARDPAHDGDVWTPGEPMADGRNAHRTNTPDELDQGIQGDYNFFEGDFRLEGVVRRIPILDRWREPIAAHDTFSTDGVTAHEWLTIGEATRRGVKFDIKQAAAIPKVIEEAKRHPQIPQERFIFNADVVRGPGGPSRALLALARAVENLTASVSDLQAIRRAFPRSCISLGAYTGKAGPGATYTKKQMDELIRYAKAIGGPGPVMFELRAEFVTPRVVKYMKPYGLIGIWNDPATYAPPDLDAAIQRFRDMGVDGMIDLRQSGPP